MYMYIYVVSFHINMRMHTCTYIHDVIRVIIVYVTHTYTCTCKHIQSHVAIALSTVTEKMKSTEVQTLGAVALHTTTACTDDANIKSTIVYVLPCLGSVHVRVWTYYSLIPKLGLLLLRVLCQAGDLLQAHALC